MLNHESILLFFFQDAAAINEWRFAKFKEFQDRNVEIENEAFDRYLKNINLLEEVFSVKSLPKDRFSATNPDSSEGNGTMIQEMKLRLRSNRARRENLRKRIQNTVDEGLKKLRKQEAASADVVEDSNALLHGRVKLKGWNAERVSIFADLNDKLNKARNEEDLKACLELKVKLHRPQTVTEGGEMDESVSVNDRGIDQESVFCPTKMFSCAEIDQEVINCVEAHFSSLEEIEDL